MLFSSQDIATTSAAAPVAARRARPATASVALGVASGAAFLALLDATVVNLAVADLRGEFAGASVTDTTWVITLYAVAFAALLAPAGRLADVVGRRRLLVWGVSAFTLFSIACAAAPSLGVLLVARGLQGAAAAVMIPASLAVVLADTPPERRAAAIGVWSAAGALAAAAGPALGGILVDTLGWRSLFLVTLPFSAAILYGARLVPAPAPRPAGTPRPPLPDLLGTGLLGAGVGLAALGITQASEWAWGDGRTVACLGVAALLVVGALVRSATHPTPAIDIELWRSRRFALANVGSLLYGTALFPWLLLGVLVLTGVWGYTPLEAGLAMTPGAIVAAVVALRAGPLVARFGPGPVVLVGALVLAAAGAIPALWLPEEPAFLAFWLPLALPIGIGTGAITTGISTAAALSVPPPQFAAGTGLNQTARQVGGALGIAALAALLADAGADRGPYLDVYLFVTLATAGVAVVGALLVREARR